MKKTDVTQTPLKKPSANTGVETFQRNNYNNNDKAYLGLKNTKSYLLGRWAIIITICNSDDAMQSNSKEMNSRIQTSEIPRKHQPSSVHGWYQTPENEKELVSLMKAVRIYSDDKRMEFGKGKYTILIMKIRKRQMMEGIELQNQGKIRTLGVKKAYKYLGILEDYTINQAETKEKIKSEYLRRTENYSKPT